MCDSCGGCLAGRHPAEYGQTTSVLKDDLTGALDAVHDDWAVWNYLGEPVGAYLVCLLRQLGYQACAVPELAQLL